MRRRRFIRILILFACLAIIGRAFGQSLPSAEQVIVTMNVMNSQRMSSMGGYEGKRRYVLDSPGMHKHAEMLVKVTCDFDGTKHFVIVSQDGWKTALKHVLQKMLETEAETSHPPRSNRTRLSTDNYEFQMIKQDLIDGLTTYEIGVTPRRHEVDLFGGRIWVDMHDYALVRVEGTQAKSPSFWVRKTDFIQTYRKSSSLWFPVSTESDTSVRIFGSTKVSINYFDYKPNSSVIPPKESTTGETPNELR